MALFDQNSPGILGRAAQWMTPERGAALQALGMGLSQLGAGQPVNLSPAYDALMQRQQRAQQQRMLEESGIMNRFTPEQRAILAQMEPSAAQRIIAETLFAPAPEGPAPTDDMREYEYAVSQGFQGTLADWINEGRRAGATVVNVGSNGIDYGSPPKDMAWLRNPDGTVRLDERGAPMAVTVAGSETDRSQVQSLTEMAGAAIDEAAASDAAQTETVRTANVVLTDIGRMREKVENAPWYSPATGFAAGWLSQVGGTNAADAAQLAETIGANIGFDRLQAMREASPTGGALGNITERELAALRAVLGSIEQSQSEDQLLANLDRLEGIYRDILAKAGAYPNAEQFGFTAGEADTPALAVEQIRQMGIAEIGQLNIGSLSGEQLDALEERMKELGL